MNSKIGVFVRSRPLLLHEARGKRCVSIDNDAVLIADKKFNFDCVFDENDNQTTIYDRCVRSLVDGCFKGFNGTVFACKCETFNRLSFLTYFRRSNW